jgi:hypothetical protein
MDFVLFAGLVALGVFAVFASCGAMAHVPVDLRGRIYNDGHDAARRP